MTPHPAIRLAMRLHKLLQWLIFSRWAQRLYGLLWLSLLALLLGYRGWAALRLVAETVCAVGALAAATELAVRSRSFQAALQQIDRTIHGVRVVAPSIPQDTDPKA